MTETHEKKVPVPPLKMTELVYTAHVSMVREDYIGANALQPDVPSTIHVDVQNLLTALSSNAGWNRGR